MATSYEVQLLPTSEQVDVLIEALREYSDSRQGAPDRTKAEIADELRLEMLKKRREARNRGN